MVADANRCPRCVHVSAPFSLAQSPLRATLTVSTSRSGRTESNERLPHSDVRPARFEVIGVQAAVTGRLESVVVVAWFAAAVVLGLVGNVVDDSVRLVGGRVMVGEPPHPVSPVARTITNATDSTETALT